MIPMAYIYVFMHGHVAPVSRGFFCDDQNLKHPEVEEKVTTPMYVRDPNLETSTKISKLIPGSSLTKGLFLLDLCIIQITKNIQFLNKKHKKP